MTTEELVAELERTLDRVRIDSGVVQLTLFAREAVELSPTNAAEIRMRLKGIAKACTEAVYALDDWITECTCGDRLAPEVTHHYEGKACKPLPRSVPTHYSGAAAVYPVLVSAIG